MTTNLVLLAVSLVLFVRDRWPIDVVALGVLLALFLTDVLTVEEAFSGFSSPTVVLIASLFLVGEGLTRSAVAAWIGHRRRTQGHRSRTGGGTAPMVRCSPAR